MEDKERDEIAIQAWKLFDDGDYEKAEPLLRRVIEAGDVRFIGQYATICGHQKRFEEEARALMMGALWGDGDLYSYVASVSNELVQNLTYENFEERAKTLFSLLKKQREEVEEFLKT